MKNKRVEPIKFGRFNIQGWSCLSSNAWQRRIRKNNSSANDYAGNAGYIECCYNEYSNCWALIISNDTLVDCYKQMYLVDKTSIVYTIKRDFKTFEAAKDHLNEFFDKFNKLKAFL